MSVQRPERLPEWRYYLRRFFVCLGVIIVVYYPIKGLFTALNVPHPLCAEDFACEPDTP